jgi:hypothetical protein
MHVRVHGLAPREGDTVFAFLVLRLAVPVDRAGLGELICRMAALVPDAEQLVSELPDDAEEALWLVGLPWSPPEAGPALDAQRTLIEDAAPQGITEAWFFQTGTRLPVIEADAAELAELADGVDDDGDDAGDAVEVEHDGAQADLLAGDDEAAALWSHGPPPQAHEVRFPVDGYPDILEELDWEGFGIAFKLAGAWIPGERTVLLGFHAMWLAPYGERYRNTAVTLDRRHHAAHLWVDRFAVPCSSHEQVHHLLWVVQKLDEVTPVLHARFGAATMAQKYGGVLGATGEPLVLGGNPLMAAYAAGGERGVDAWIAAQTDWSDEELAEMLRELAVEIVVRRDPGLAAGGAGRAGRGGRGGRDAPDPHANQDIEHDPGSRRGLTSYAGELLAARAQAGVLDPRVAEKLRPLLAVGAQGEQRCTAVVSILGALRDRASVPAMLRLLEATPRPAPACAASACDPTGRAELLTATVTALGAIADPAAIPALSRLVAAPGPPDDRSRAAAASALAACRAAVCVRPAGGQSDRRGDRRRGRRHR